MSNHILFLVHGMGKPTHEMFTSWQNTIRDLFNSYVEDEPEFDDIFSFAPINYDPIFEELRNAWNDSVDMIVGAATDQGIELPDADELKLLTDDNFFGTHIMDVLLYRFFPQVSQRVRAYIIAEFQHVLDASPEADFSVIAHSLGTSVMHDSIHTLYHNHPTAPDGEVDPNSFHFDTIAMLANVSRTLETNIEAYDSIVRPEKKEIGWNYACRSMLSASHKYDPLVSLKRFKPGANWPDQPASENGRFTYAEPTVFQEWNIHGMEHYLEDPSVHIPLFRYLWGQDFINDVKEQNAIAVFKENNPVAEFEEYAERLKNIIQGDEDFSFKELVEIFKGFQAAVKEFSGE